MLPSCSLRKRRFHNVQSPGRDGGNVAGVDGDDSHPTAGKKPKTRGSGDARQPAMEFAFVKQTLMTPGGDAPSPLILLSDVINEWEFGAAMFKISGNGKPTVPLVVFSEQHFTGKARDRLGTVLTVLRKQEANPRVLLMTGHAPSEAYDCVLRASVGDELHIHALHIRCYVVSHLEFCSGHCIYCSACDHSSQTTPKGQSNE